MSRIVKTILFTAGLLSFFSVYAAIPPITVTAVSASYPVSVTTSATTTVTYTLRDNINNPHNPSLTIYPQLVTGNNGTITSAGSIAESGGTCSSGVTYNNTCTIQLTYTAPSSVLAANPATASIVFGYAGRNNIESQAASFLIASAPTTTTISANVGNILFSFNDANATGTMGTGYSTITITNSGSTAATTVAPSSLPSGVTLSSSSGCGSVAASGGTCTMIFTTNATPDSAQSISIAGTNTNTLTLPIAPLSIRIYSSPVNPVPTSASLMLVNTCTTPELLAITNNSASAVTSLTFDTSAFTSVTTNVSNCPVSSLPAGKTCVVGITANTTAVNTSGANILMGWNSASAQGAIFTGVEATGATLPNLSTPTVPVTTLGGLVYQKDTTCNIVKLAALADQYTPGSTVSWTTAAFQSTTVPNPSTGTGTGAQNTGLTAGQVNNTAIVFQASPGATYAAGLCAQYSETSGGVNYAGWYLPWDNGDASGTTITELAAMYTNLRSGQGSGTNGFADGSYWSSSEFNSNFARDRIFFDGIPDVNFKFTPGDSVRCSRALTY